MATNFLTREFDVGRADRTDEATQKVFGLLEALGWEHYPANVTGEELDAGNDSDEAMVEAVEFPDYQLPVYNFLEEMGVFDP